MFTIEDEKKVSKKVSWIKSLKQCLNGFVQVSFVASKFFSIIQKKKWNEHRDKEIGKDRVIFNFKW